MCNMYALVYKWQDNIALRIIVSEYMLCVLKHPTIVWNGEQLEFTKVIWFSLKVESAVCVAWPQFAMHGTSNRTLQTTQQKNISSGPMQFLLP